MQQSAAILVPTWMHSCYCKGSKPVGKTNTTAECESDGTLDYASCSDCEYGDGLGHKCQGRKVVYSAALLSTNPQDSAARKGVSSHAQRSLLAEPNRSGFLSHPLSRITIVLVQVT